MAVKVVVTDAARLPAGVEFPPLERDSYSWEEYPDLGAADVAERCRNADVVVTLGAPMTSELLEKTTKLGLLICVGEACARMDQSAAASRGVELLAFADADLSDFAAAQDLCDRVSAAIDHYLRTRRAPEGGA